MKTKIAYIFLIVLSCLPLITLIQPGFPITHDGQDHVARIANFYASLSEGVIVPRWAANLNWGYGHPILMFLYPLPSYVASVFHALGFSFVDSTKLVFAVAYIAGSLGMYLWMRAAWGGIAGFVGALLYSFAPYRFVDLYVRGAIGEHMAFACAPFVFWGIQKRNIPIIAVAFASLVLAHNAISLMFIPFLFLYTVYLGVFEKEKRRTIFASIFGLGLGFMLSSFFWLSAFLEGKYTLRNIVTAGGLEGRFVSWVRYLYSPWNYGGGNDLTKEIGPVHWIAVFGALVVWLKAKERRMRWFVGVGIVAFVGTLWFMTEQAAFIWNSVSLLQNFQFPWRFLTVIVFLSATLGAVAASYIPKKYIWTIALVAVVLLGSTIQMWKPKGYAQREETFYSSVYNGTTDTGESSPIWSVRFMEKRPQAPALVVDGEATIQEVSRSTTKHIYTIDAKVRSNILENTLYFPGWVVYVDGQPVGVEFQNPAYRGLMTYYVDPGVHAVVISFEDTKLRAIANGITVAGIILLLCMIVSVRFGKKTKKV